LSDGIFAFQESKFAYIFEQLRNDKRWYILSPIDLLKPFGIFCNPLAYYGVVWYIFPRFGILCQEKSGNPVGNNYMHT
jgi:hypothetical protein